MKKILSLLVVSMLVLASFSMTAFAADFGYNLHTFASGGNAMNADGIIPLFIRSVGSTYGGYIEVQYDATKVVPVVYSEYEDEDTGETVVSITDATASTAGKDVVVSVNATKVDDGCTLDFANSKIKANFFATSPLANNKQAIKIFFRALDKTTDNWNEKTFVVTDAYVEDDSNTPADLATMTLTKTYANATVEAEEDNTVTEEWTAADAPADFVAPTVEGEVRKVAVFGKNAEGAASTLTAGSYGVRFGGNEYVGMADVTGQYWAIVLVDTDGKYITPGYTYEGTAFAGTFSWPVSVSAN